MQAVSDDMSVIEKGIEALISNAKLYINSRQEEEFDVLNRNIRMLRIELDSLYDNEKTVSRPNNILILNIISKIISKFEESLSLLDEIKNIKPIYREIDTRYMLDVLLRNIKILISYKDKKGSIDKEKLRSDLELVKSLRDQHKRILITYLMQDWQNLNQVLILMKISEIYKTIAEELIDFFLFSIGEK